MSWNCDRGMIETLYTVLIEIFICTLLWWFADCDLSKMFAET